VNENVAVILAIVVALAAVGFLIVALVGLALLFPASTRSRGGKLLLIGGAGLIVFAGTCFGVLPLVAG
jgi:hypothetical protein